MSILAPPKRAQKYNIYKLVIYNKDSRGRGLVIGRFEVAAPDRKAAQDAGDRWCTDRGYQPDWNCQVSVVRKMIDQEWATILVAQ